MALTKMDGFSGEAVVLGRLLRVSFDKDHLTLHGVSLEEAQTVLEALATKHLVAVSMPVKEKGGVAQPPPTPPPPGALPPIEELQRHRQSQKVDGAKPPADPSSPAATQAVVAEAKAAEAKKEEKPNQGEPHPPPPPRDPAEKELSPQPPASAPADHGIPQKIVESKRFIEVLDWVMKTKGLKPADVDKLVEEMEGLRKHVPVVQRVRDVKDKVVSNLAAWTESSGA